MSEESNVVEDTSKKVEELQQENGEEVLKSEESKLESEEKKEEQKEVENKDEEKVENGEKENKEEEEVESEKENETTPLLEQSLTISGKRERKSIQRLEIAVPEQVKTEIASGKGDKLGDIPRVVHFLDKHTYEDLKLLHRVCFNTVGRKFEIKKNIKHFCGFEFDEKSAEFEKKKDILNKAMVSNLKLICEILDLERGGNKTELIDRILNFLLLPKDSGKALPKVKKHPKKATKGAKKVTKEDKHDEEEDEEEEQEETKTPRKKVAKKEKTTSTPKRGKKVEVEEKTEDEEEEEEKALSEDEKEVASKNKKQSPKKKAVKRKRQQKEEDEVAESASEDEEPESKSPKTDQLTDEQIRECVTQILKGANLESITMRNVIKQVSAKFQDHDLSRKQDLIKDIVKELINESSA